MRLSVWSDGSSPVYLNPDLKEIAELGASRVDTLRICEEPGQLAVASGFGNTHESVTKIARGEWGKRWSGLDLILYRLGDEWFFNGMGHWPEFRDDSRVPWKRGLSLCQDVTAQFVRDFVSFVG